MSDFAFVLGGVAIKLLVNNFELVTHERLSEICAAHGANVCPKVRVKDAIPVDGSGVSDEDFSFSLRSHFDFVVVDADWNTLFAVEFDGPCHDLPAAARRDDIKNRLCERFNLPLLRLNANYLEKKFRRWDLLSYLVETWFLRQWFYDAQIKGHIPEDEIFDPCFILSDNSGENWPYWFSLPSQLEIQRLHRAGKVAEMAASELVGQDIKGNYFCLSHIKVDENKWALARTGMRSQQFPMYTSEVLSQIGTVQLFEQVQKILRGEETAASDDETGFALRQFDERHKWCSFGGYVHDIYVPKMMR